MCLAHLGMAFCVAGAGLTSVYSVERDVRLAPGDSVELAGYTFAFMATRHAEGPNFSTEIGDFSVEREGRTLELHAEKRAGEIGDDAFHLLEMEFDWAELSAA